LGGECDTLSSNLDDLIVGDAIRFRDIYGRFRGSSIKTNAEVALGGSPHMLRLIELIYDAVGDSSLWNLVMEGVAEAINGQWTVVWSSFDHPAASDITAWSRLDPTILPAYSEHYASVNVIAQGIERLYPNDLITYSHHIISDTEFEKCEYYNDYLKPNGMYYAYGMKVDLGLEAPAFLSSVRSKTRGPFGDPEGLVFETLLPHLQRAMKLHLQFSQLRTNAGGFESALNAFDVAVFGLDARGKVVLLNLAAKQISQAGDGISLRHGKLCAPVTKQNTRLQSLIFGVLSAGIGFDFPHGGALLLSRRLNASALRVTVTPVPCTLSGHTGRLAALVFIADPDRKPLSRSDTLKTLFALSPTECRIADLLTAGCDVTACAEMLLLTVSTTRFHLKSIFRKTATRRQTDLIRLVLGIPGRT
jgi:DNA-binding CsgD family transcriptional regulator